MTQLPLFPLPPTEPKPDAQDRLQALCDALLGDPEFPDEYRIVLRHDGWYLSGPARWFGDDGLDWIGRNEKEAADYLRNIGR